MNRLTYVLVAVSAVFGADSNGWQRIIDGSEGDISMFPYQAMITYHGILHCGGVIIGPTTILSSAHCVGENPKLTQNVYVGISELPKPTDAAKMYTISEVHEHPSYRLTNWSAVDIVVFRISTPLTYGPEVQPIRLADRLYPLGTRVVVSGWGYAESGFPDRIRFTELQIVDPSNCHPHVKIVCTVHPTNSPCNGDSGGPLVADGVLIGLVSGGKTDLSENCRLYDVYASIYNLQEFIRSSTTDVV